MLLTCCFRGSAKKKPKKNKSWNKEGRENTKNEYSNVLSQTLIDSPIIPDTIIKPGSNLNLADSQDSKINQVYFEASEREIKTIADKDGVHSPKDDSCFIEKDICAAQLKILRNQANSQELINISRIPRKESYSEDVHHQLAEADETDLNSSQDFPRSEQLHFTKKTVDTFITSTPHAKQPGHFAKKELFSKCIKLNAEKENLYDELSTGKEEKNPIMLFSINEVLKNSEEKSTEQLEELQLCLQKMKEENEKKIEDLQMKHQNELEKAKENFEAKLCEAREDFQKNLEKALIDSKNKANEDICHLNEEMVLERGKMFTERQSNIKHLETEFKIKEARLDKSILDVEAREKSWQEEKATVIEEVQVLKAEATRMVKILAMEFEEDDHMTEDKRRSLSQEVYSLHLVVEMKTEEVRSLRKQLDRNTQLLEQAEKDKEIWRKVKIRMEDLEEQLKVKAKQQSQLALEKDQLELNMNSTTKEADRMSKNVETLQWRIKNNFAVPVESLRDEAWRQEYQEKQPLESVSLRDKTIEMAKPVNIVNSDTDGENSDIVGEIENVPQEIYQDPSDSYSLDEGVGDILSDGESPDSLVADQANKKGENFIHEDEYESSQEIFTTKPINKSDNFMNNGKLNSTLKERIPSRF